jgi:hypothetical protein
MMLTAWNNLGSLIILFVPIQSAGTYFNGLYAGTCVGLAAMLYFFARDSSTRYKLDVPGDGNGDGAAVDAAAATKTAAGEEGGIPLLTG